MKARNLVIAYSLFKKTTKTPEVTNKYIVGMLANIEAIKELMPTAEVWIYHDASIGVEWLNLLEIAQKHSGIKIILKCFDYSEYRVPKESGHLRLFGTLIRYLALADFTGSELYGESILLLRDADMVMNQEDLHHIAEFQKQSDKLIHRYVDSLHYDWPIIGGSFAIKPTFLKTMGFTAATWSKQIFKFAKKEMQETEPFRYFVDQRFLKEIYARLKKQNQLDLIASTEVHIPILGENQNVKKTGHYKLWWCDIADDIPTQNFSTCKNLEEWLCQHSDVIKGWIEASQRVSKDSSAEFKSMHTLFSRGPATNKRKLDRVEAQDREEKKKIARVR